MIRVEYNKPKLHIEKKGKSMRTYRTKVKTNEVVTLKEIENTDKELVKQPHVIAERPGVQLWKFFRSMIEGEMRLLEEPRYIIRLGNDWMKIISMKTI